MAQSKSFYNDVKEELECPVCREQFSATKVPKLLNCLHTFCKACLEKLLRRHGGGDIPCPLCRGITDCPNNDIGDMTSNLFYKRMVEIVEAYSGHGDEGMPPCGNCEKSKPLRFHCFDCNYFLCADCAEGHKNFKALRGHRVKEIGQFKSNDYEDFARRGNFCKQHKEELKFYCVQCQICICRDCAILVHREHKSITFKEALEVKTSQIETKMRKVERNNSRLKNQKKYLEERMAKVNKSVEQARDEVDRVAEERINLIREHQANVTTRLVERASEVDSAFSRESSSVSEKMMEIEHCLKFTHEVLARNNLLEILNVKETLAQRLEELSMPFQPAAQLNYFEVKYISNYMFPSSDALGKLVLTKTEPSLSVVEGIGTTESLQGEEFSFTVTTKDLEGHVSYNEMDKIVVEINYKEEASNIKANIADLKDGRYTVCFKPEAAGECEVSIQVNGESIMGSPFLLKVRPQLVSVLSRSSRSQEKVVQSVKEEEHIHGLKLSVKPYELLQGNAEELEVFERVTAKFREETLKIFSREEISSNLKEISNKSGIECHESIDEFILSGSFKQIKESRFLLQQRVVQSPKSSANALYNGLNTVVPSSYGYRFSSSDDRSAVSGALVKGSLTETAAESPNAAASQGTQHYDTIPKLMAFLTKVHGNELRDIEQTFHVVISRRMENNTIFVKAEAACNADDYEKACDRFITLYQSVHQKMRLARFSLENRNDVKARQTIYEIGKKYPVLVEIGGDRKMWELYGEKDVVDQALEELQQRVNIKRDIDGSGGDRRKNGELTGSSEDEETMDVDPSVSTNGTVTPLVTKIGKVTLSVSKGDITNEQVDVIVNAANDLLIHVGGVARAIRDKGGRSIQEESDKIIRENGPMKNGDAVVTRAGNLPCKMVVHAVGPIWNVVGPKKSQKVLRRACLNSFHETQKHKMSSIALPAISSGLFGMPKDVCAEVMFDAVGEFVRKVNPENTTITDIRFVNIDDPTVQAFKKEFLKRIDTSQGEMQRTNGGGMAFSRHSAVAEGASAAPDCAICLDNFTNPRTLKCGHAFCTGCLREALKRNNMCPVCKEPQGVVKGTQPPGQMNFHHNHHLSLPGFPARSGTIVINYYFPTGIQGSEHPNPGQRYIGTSRTAYLPDTREGNEVLQLLRRAFDAQLVFTVGTSITTGQRNQVTWNDIHHKTSLTGGPEQFGYPDPDYLQRVKEDLAAKGIR